MKAKNIIGTAVVIMLFMMGVRGAQATALTECLTLQGFLRYEFGIHTDVQNPNLAENHHLTLSKFFLQTEWSYKPSDAFKLFANIRLQGDTTSLWDSNLRNYNAFPVDVPKYDWMMMKASEDHFRAEVWELYSDITLGNLWLRLGRQQIAWGEMIGGRYLDAINALDQSWNLAFEPEEFEIIRIPAWSIRGIYQITQSLTKGLTDTTIEAFVNPGDWYPNFLPDQNAPFQVLPNVLYAPYMKIDQKDRRGDPQWGVRLGGKVGGFYLTLNYLSLYSQDFSLKFKGFHYDPINGIPFGAPYDMTPLVMDLDACYPHINIFGASANYAFGDPYNLVVSFEGVWIPDQPYADARSALSAIKDQGTFKYAINFTRPTPLLPPTFLHASFATIIFQFGQNVVEGDYRWVGQRSKTAETLVLAIQQPLMYNDLTPGFQVVFDPRGKTAHYLRPSVHYAYGDHWYFDVFGTIFGGDRKSTFGGTFYWADTVYGRITYQF